MSWQDFLRQARDELLRAGGRTNPELVVARALELPGAREVYEARSERAARASARRDARDLLKEAGEMPSDDNSAQLFETVAFEAPRAITFRDSEGEVWHKAIEHATREELDAHVDLLSENSVALQRKLWAFQGFVRDIAPYLATGATVGDALRAMGDDDVQGVAA